MDWVPITIGQTYFKRHKWILKQHTSNCVEVHLITP
jgi:hypothetical protein